VVRTSTPPDAAPTEAAPDRPLAAPERWLGALVEQYRGTLKPRELEELPDLWFCRPPAFVVAKLLARTRVTPDEVSLVALLWSLVVGYGYWRGDALGLWVGAISYYLWNVLDCVDGQLARMTKQSSPVGYILDEVVDQISTVVLFVGIAGGLSHARPGEHNWWLVTAGIGLLMGIECGVLEAKRHEWQARVYHTRKSASEDLSRAVALAGRWRAAGVNPLGRFVVRFHQVQRWLGTLYLPKGDREPAPSSAAADASFARHHRKVLRMAVWLGPTTQMFVTLVCTALGRLDYYLWAVLFVGGPWMLLVHLAAYLARRQERRDLAREI
jgi:phosphatidylglycerophosphate synthase